MTKNVISFDDFDNAQAVREGWGLFNANGVLEIQRIDEPDLPDPPAEGWPSHLTDEHAVLHVTSAAAAGSAYHQQALRLNGESSWPCIDLDGDQDAPQTA